MKVSNGDMPAMPTVYQESPGDELYCDFVGLTKREAIAMHVLGDLASRGEISERVTVKSRLAVEYADALLKELEHGKS